MGRRTFSDKREGAIKSESDYNALKKVIEQLHWRAIGHKRIDLSHEDLRRLFVNGEHRRTTEETVSIMGMGPSDRLNVHWGDVELRFTLRGNRTFRFPNYAGQTLFMNERAHDTIAKWVDWRLQRGQEWGLVLAVFRALDQHCKSLEQMRFYWPAIFTLLASSQYTGHQAERFRAMTVPKSILALPFGLKQACQDSMETMAKALLLPSEVPDDDSPVSLSMEMSDRKFRSPWGDFNITML